MTCGDQIFVFATGFWENELNSPSNYSVQTFSGWVTTPFALGKLGNLIYRCYSGVSGCVSPDIGDSEFAIMGEMFKVDYYQRLAMAAAGAGGTLPLVELKEGDSTIRWTNSSSLMKEYVAMSKQANEELQNLVAAYLAGQNTGPSSVLFYNIVSPNTYNGGGQYGGRTTPGQ